MHLEMGFFSSSEKVFDHHGAPTKNQSRLSRAPSAKQAHHSSRVAVA
jgi:hypothetical protein